MTALIVIDMQQKYLSMYDAGLMERVNANINAFLTYRADAPVIYVKNIGKPENAAQYELAEELLIASDLIFEKSSPSSFTSEAFVEALELRNVDALEIIGVDGNCCVARTAMDAAKKGYKTRVMVDCVGVRNVKLWKKTIKKLEETGIVVLSGSTY